MSNTTYGADDCNLVNFQALQVLLVYISEPCSCGDVIYVTPPAVCGCYEPTTDVLDDNKPLWLSGKRSVTGLFLSN